MDKDHYKILGIERNASSEEVKRAYRQMARHYHPDKNDHPQAEEQFKKVAAAFEVLSDKVKRDDYDRNCRQATDQPPTDQPPTDQLTSFRGLVRGLNGKGLILYTGVFVVGCVTYRLWRSGKLGGISQAGIKNVHIIKDSEAASALGSQLAYAASAPNVLTMVGKISQAGIEKIGIIIKDSDAASALKTPPASMAAPAETIIQAAMKKMYNIVHFAYTLKDSEAVSAIGSQVASSASSVASASKDGLSKVGKISQAGIEKICIFLNWAAKVKDSEAASAIGSQVASSASSVASASKDVLPIVGKISQAGIEKICIFLDWAAKVKDSEAASAIGSQVASSASSVASASKDGLSKVGEISKANIEKIGVIIKDFDAATALTTLPASLAASAEKISQASMKKIDTVANVASKLIDWLVWMVSKLIGAFSIFY